MHFLKRLKTILQSNLFYLILSLFLIFFVFYFTQIKHYSSAIPDDIKELVATIESFKIDGNKLSLELKGKENFVATYYISTEEEKNNLIKKLKIGQQIKVIGEKNKLINNTIQNTFNYKKYLYNKKIYFSFSVEKMFFLDSKISIIYKIKNKISERIKKLGNNPYLEAFILGEKNLMSEEVKQTIQDNGVSHLFALSGMHLSFVYAFLNKILSKIKGKKIIIYSILLLYLAISGFSVSFIRAILLTMFLDLNKLFSLSISKIKILILIAIILLFVNPFYIYDIGFIYTFVVTFSLLYSKDILSKRNKLTEMFLVSLITFLFSIPITIYINYEINLFSILNNIILVPLVSSIIFPLSIITFIFPFLLPSFNFLTVILEKLNNIFDIFSFMIVFGKINIFDVLIYYLLLLLILKMKKTTLYMLFIVHLIFLYNKNIFENSNSIYFLDVGQGDSILLTSPKNKEVIMIDTGGKIDYQKEKWEEKDKEYCITDTIVDFFKSIRIRKIDKLILTHGDFDHMGEAINLVENFKVEKVIFNCGELNELEQALIKVLDKKKIPYYSCIKELNIDDNKLYFLNNKDYGNENDNSSVIYTELNEHKFLFMGDAGVEVEEDLIKKYNLQNTDILKVGHHGSKTSSSKAFIDEVDPNYSIISVGKNNRYGHPNNNVLDNLKQSIIYRTDQDGSIMFKIRNNNLNIETCSP